MNQPRRIILHHSLTKDSKSVSWGAIRRYHMFVRGWADIAYHAGIELIGEDFECMYGRPDTDVGAHSRGQNVDSLGFVFVGNYDEEEPDPLMLAIAARRVIVPWMKLYDIPLENIHGHRDYSTKSCPGDMFDMGLFKDIAESEFQGEF